MSMWKWLSLGSVSVVAVYLLKRHFSGGVCNCDERLDGKVIIITGANSGIGREAAQILSQKGATVVLACRNRRDGEHTVYLIYKATGNLTAICMYLDLSSFKSITSFVKQLNARGFSDIYALINNAGIFYHPFQLTEDNFEVTFQTNYLGPFFLTALLLNNNYLKDNSRIINVVSEAHRFPKTLDLNKVADPKPEIGQFLKYGESKLCLALLTKKLASHLKGISVFSVDPGNVETKVFRHFPLLNNKFLFYLQKPLRWILVKTPEQGAQTIVHVASNPSCTSFSGCYFSDCKVKSPSTLVEDKELSESLWNLSLKLCGITLNSPVENVPTTSK